VNTAYQVTADKVDPRHPFALTTGRLRDQWHGMSRTGTVPQLFAHAAEPVINMHPQDMQRRFLKNGDLVHVSNRRGTQIFAVSESDDLRAGQTFIGMHWGEEFISGRGHGQHVAYGVNALMSPATDPVSRQPELKHAQ
jgi:assimilatory nitrate reductase catalytic subunit